ncbi:insulinase family protein [Flavobacteriaceae bacterium MHTCC 0001]
MQVFAQSNEKSQPNEIHNYDLEAEIPKDTTAIRGILPNGLKYYIKENNRPKETVFIHLIVKAGFLQEDEKQHGLAHLLEHMGFNGTKNYKKDKLIKYIESIGMEFGADLNAGTGQSTTTYKLKVPSKDLKKVDAAFQIIEDWAHNILLKDEAINAERPIIIEEFRRWRGSSQRVGDQIRAFLYDGMKQLDFYALDKQVKNIETFDADDLRRFYKDWYRPNLMGIVVAGDIDAKYIEHKIKAHFKDLTNPVNEKPLKTYDSVPYHEVTRVKIITDPERTVTSLNLNFIDRFPTRKEKIRLKHRKEGIIKSMMRSMINDRLYELSNSDTSPFIKARCGVNSTLSKYHYNFSIGATAKENEIEKSLKHLVLELERIKRFGFTQEELDREKKDRLASNALFWEKKDDWDSNRYLGLLESEFKNDWVLYSKEWAYNFDKTIIPQITLADVKDLFMTYYHKDNRALILTAPEKEDIQLPNEATLLQTIVNAEQDSTLSAYKPKKVKQQLLKALPVKGSIVSETNDAHGIKKLELSNGAKVFYKKTDFDKESVRFKAFSYGGTSLLSDEEFKSVGILTGLAKVTGIGGYKDYELSKFLAGKKIKVSTFVDKYDEGLKGSARTSDLETMFKLIYLNFTSLNNDEKLYLSIVDKIKAVSKNRKLSPSAIFSSEINKITQKGNPRYVDLNIYENITRILDSVPYSDVYNTYVERFENAGDFNFFFIGDFDEDILKEYVATYLAALPSVDAREDYKLSSYKNILKGERIEVYKGLEDKATLRMEFATEAKYDNKENDALKIFGKVFEGELRNRIREDKGGVYSIGANLRYRGRPYSRYVGTISFTCDPENADMLEKETLLVLKELLKKGVTKKQVENVKENWMLNRKKSLETNGFWLNHMYNKTYWKQPFTKGIDDYKEKLYAISPKFINKVARKYIKSPSLVASLLPEKVEETTR